MIKLASALVAASLLAAPLEQARADGFDVAAKACLNFMRNKVDYQFAAYVVNDGAHNKVRVFGTDAERFAFSSCMNALGEPLDH